MGYRIHLVGRYGAVAVCLLLLALAAGCAAVPHRQAFAEEADAPVSVDELVAQGDSAYARGDYERALLGYVKALAADTGNVDILYKIATAHRELGNTQVAAHAYNQVLAEQPQHAGALEGMGLVLLGRGLNEQARQRLTQAVAADGSRWQALNGLGVIADLDKEPERAREFYLRAYNLQPRATSVLNNLGYSYYLSGDWDEAKRYYGKALAIDAGSRKAWSNLGLLYVRESRYVEAVNAFERVMSRAQALNSVGYLCMIEGRYRQAKDFLVKAIDRSPSYYVEAQENLQHLRMLMQNDG